jgi:hypothetical protein
MDERKELQRFRMQSKKEIREFEYLCKDISFHNKRAIQDLEKKLQLEMVECRAEIDEMSI